MLGSVPDPKKDNLLGEDNTIQLGKHDVNLELLPGIYSIYTIGIDKAGNVSQPSQPVQIEVGGKKK